MTGSVENGGRPAVRAPSIDSPPSLVELAATTLRRMIVGGDLLCGERIVENRLTQELGISRPPLREALRVLAREGLVRQVPRKGAMVTPLTLHDIYEIFTLRREFEHLAVRLGVPVTEPGRLRRCRDALAQMTGLVDDPASFAEHTFEFHVAVVGLSGHHRLEEAYRALQLQMMLCMALNRRARHRDTFLDEIHRHEQLLKVIEDGEPDRVLQALTRHGDRTFLDGIEARVPGHTEVALRWLAQERANQEEP